MSAKTIVPVSLQVFIDDHVIFQSSGSWLYPLFDFEDHLAIHPVDISKAIVRDKVIGKAAALLLIRLGAGFVHGELMSDRAIKVLERCGTSYEFDNAVEKIDCKTEELLVNIEDPEIAYQILCKRAKRC